MNFWNYWIRNVPNEQKVAVSKLNQLKQSCWSTDTWNRSLGLIWTIYKGWNSRWHAFDPIFCSTARNACASLPDLSADASLPIPKRHCRAVDSASALNLNLFGVSASGAVSSTYGQSISAYQKMVPVWQLSVFKKKATRRPLQIL